MEREGLMNGGDVAESDDRPRIAPHGVVVQALQNAHGAIAAAGEEKRVVFVRRNVMVELFRPLVIAPGKVAAMVMIDVRGERNRGPGGLEVKRRLTNAMQLRRRGGRENNEAGVGREGARSGQRHAAQSV